MRQDDKFSWLLRQTGTLAEMSLLQTFVIACHPKATTIDGRVFPPFHVWLAPAEIARRSGLHERTVPEIVERLKQRGLIASAGRHGKTGQIRVHRLLIDATESPKESASFDDDEARGFLHQSPSLSASKDESFCIPLIEGKRESKRELKREKTRVSKSRDFVTEFPQYLTAVDAQVLVDWQALRKQQRAPITSTVLASIGREAGKAGMSMNEALTMMCARNWQGFRASWISGEQAGNGGNRRSRHTGFDRVNYDEEIPQ